MDTIRLNNDQCFTLITCGVSRTDTKLELSFISELSSAEVKAIFKNQNNTKLITLSSGGTEYEYGDFVIYKSITESIIQIDGNDMEVYTIVLEKKDLRTELKELQEVVDILLISNLEGGA